MKMLLFMENCFGMGTGPILVFEQKHSCHYYNLGFSAITVGFCTVHDNLFFVGFEICFGGKWRNIKPNDVIKFDLYTNVV